MPSTANDPALRSWVEVPPHSDFPIQNLPFGIGKPLAGGAPRVCSAIGDWAIDLSALAAAGHFADILPDAGVLSQPYLNPLIALGKDRTKALRERLSLLLRHDVPTLRDDAALRAEALLPMSALALQMPVFVRDYTDFYSSREHATNVGTMFRDPANALLPNWLHLPVGYHGRASSINVSGTPVRRPKGQLMPDGAERPLFGPTRLLDFELEMAFVIGKENPQGQPVAIGEADDYIFGLLLFNDWSARDIQKWEYVPLGPFLAKNFASTVSPWIVTLEALEPFRVAGPAQDPEVLPYLRYEGERNYDIQLEVAIGLPDGQEQRVCRSNFKHMYWNMAQQLAHHTVGGCNMSVGDLCASGTISGPTPDSYGSMLELSWRGSKPLPMPDGSQRKFIQDGDTVIMRGYAEREGLRIGFGEVRSTVLPAED